MSGYFQQGRSALPHAQQVRIVGGFNGWRHELFDFVLKPRPDAPEVRSFYQLASQPAREPLGSLYWQTGMTLLQLLGLPQRRYASFQSAWH
jgi:hypothetical protein